MAIEYDLVANHILSLSSGQISRRRHDAVVTALLLLGSRPGNPTLAYDGLREGRYQIDSQFVVALLRTASKKVQWAIVWSPAFWHLPKQLYRQYFFHFWRLRRRDKAWRWVLGWSLHPFLMNNSPQEGPSYARIIWALARDPDEGIALSGLGCTGYLGSALTLEQAKTLVALTARKSEKAFSAKSNIGTLYKDFESLRPEVKAFFLDPRTVAKLRINHDPTDTDKWGSHNWCLMNMRKVLRRTGTRPALRLVT